MSYSTNKLNAVADCDLLLAMASKEKANLNFKQLSEQRQKTSYSESSVEIDAELQSVIAEIAATETIITTLPAGPSKEDALKKKTKLEYRKFLLDGRKESHGIVALLEKEMGLARLNLELSEIDTFINEVTSRKAAI